MKTCQACQNEHEDDVATCANCGEASWSVASSGAARPEAPAMTTEGQSEGAPASIAPSGDDAKRKNRR